MSEEKLDRIIEGVARIDERTLNLEKYIGAVSSNQKDTAAKLDVHIQDTDTAHGAAVREKDAKNWVSWVAFGISAVVALLKAKEALHVH